MQDEFESVKPKPGIFKIATSSIRTILTGVVTNVAIPKIIALAAPALNNIEAFLGTLENH